LLKELCVLLNILQFSKGAQLMRNFFANTSTAAESGLSLVRDDKSDEDGEGHNSLSGTSVTLTNDSDVFMGYLSDISDDQLSLQDESDASESAGNSDLDSCRTSCRIKPPQAADTNALHVQPAPQAIDDSEFPHMDKEAMTLHMFRVQQRPLLKRRKLDVPYRVAHQLSQEQQRKEYACALSELDQLIQSKREVFEAGHNGLQAYRA
jgi:hypothetical protein